MDSNKDIIELLRECAAQNHGMAKLRDSLGIGLESGWQQRCIGKVADEIESAYMKLPLDADGVPIRPGDTVMIGSAKCDVTGVSNDSVCICNDYDARHCRLVQSDTVEFLLEEFVHRTWVWNDEDGKNAVLAEYADRIRRACNG